MRDLLLDLVDAAARHSDYAEARHVERRLERLATRNGVLDQLDDTRSEGIGIRVRIGGVWGFACSRGHDRAGAEAAVRRAVDLARSQPTSAAAELAPEPPAQGSWANPVELDPFTVALEDKLSLLEAADTALRDGTGVSLTLASYEALRTRTTFVSSEGAACDQTVTECGGGLSAVVLERGESQVRSFPSAHGGAVAQAGYEHFLGLDLVGRAPHVGAEAQALIRAPACPSRRTTLILAGDQLGLQIHESIGHAVELDRVLGRETSYAGGSFVTPDAAGSLRIGSAEVGFTADATTPGGLGSYRWDDEGVEGQRVPIVREGVLAGFLSSRETAAEIGLERSGGCARADGFTRQPIVRMTNVNLEPGGAGTLEDLIADTEDGILIDTNRSWSIDDRRLHFQFEGEAAWEIRGGERTRLLRNPSYAGVTPELWSGCDAVCSPEAWTLSSFIDCGKGEPGQMARVSHGAPPARFRDVDVGVV